MKISRILFLSVSFYSILAVSLPADTYAASEVSYMDEIRTPEDTLPVEAMRASKIKPLSETGGLVVEEPISESEKRERFLKMTGKSPEQMFKDMKNSNQEALQSALEKNVSVGLKTDRYAGRQTLTTGNEMVNRYETENNISGSAFLSGQLPAGAPVAGSSSGTATGVGIDTAVPVTDINGTAISTTDPLANVNSTAVGGGSAVVPATGLNATTLSTTGVTPVRTGVTSGQVTPVIPTSVIPAGAVTPRIPGVGGVSTTSSGGSVITAPAQ